MSTMCGDGDGATGGRGSGTLLRAFDNDVDLEGPRPWLHARRGALCRAAAPVRLAIFIFLFDLGSRLRAAVSEVMTNSWARGLLLGVVV